MRNSEKHYIYNKQWRQKHKEQGLCQDCNEPVLGQHRCCAKHLALRQVAFRKVQKGWLSEGKCCRCGAPLQEGENTYCVACQVGRHMLIPKVVSYAVAE